jgi:hypothetical protein
MNRFFAFVLGVASVVLLPTLSQAAVLGDLVEGVQNELEDDNFEMLVNAGGTIAAPGADTIVNVGDFLLGIIRISAIRVPPGGPAAASYPQPSNTFTGVFAQKVATAAGAGIGGAPDGILDANFSFIAPSLAEWAALGLPAHLIPITPGTNFIMFDDPDDLDQTLPLLGAFGSVGGTKLWEFGLSATATIKSVASTDTDDVTTAFAAVTGATTANLDLLASFGPGANVILAPQPVLGGTADMLLRNGSLGNPAPGSSFPVSSDVDLLITPNFVVPEPASILVWRQALASRVAGEKTRPSPCLMFGSFLS